MDTMTMILGGATILVLVLYMLRRRGRLSREDD